MFGYNKSNYWRFFWGGFWQPTPFLACTVEGWWGSEMVPRAPWGPMGSHGVPWGPIATICCWILRESQRLEKWLVATDHIYIWLYIVILIFWLLATFTSKRIPWMAAILIGPLPHLVHICWGFAGFPWAHGQAAWGLFLWDLTDQADVEHGHQPVAWIVSWCFSPRIEMAKYHHPSIWT